MGAQWKRVEQQDSPAAAASRGKKRGKKRGVARRVRGEAASVAAAPRGVPAEGYVVGQVADSLGPGGAAAPPLARLFSGTTVAPHPPVLVAVPGKNRKRKRTEVVEKASEDQSFFAVQEPPKKTKKARKKELPKAEEKLANRESSLERADEEEQKPIQKKAKEKKGASCAITKSVANSHTDTAVEKHKKKKVADETVNRRTVFVGNLPVSCTAQMLKSLFKEYGQIKSIRFRSLVPAEDTLSKKIAAIKHKVHPNAKFINAYVVFKEECDAIKALKENGKEIASGFHIRVDIASKTSSHDNKRSVFLGNLSYGMRLRKPHSSGRYQNNCIATVVGNDISDNAVREHFIVCGGVVAVRIVRDRNTGLGKGFGYVLFENTDAVHLALKLNDSLLLGRKVRVKRCGEKWKAPQKSPARSRAPKGRVYTTLKNKKCSNDSFVGEKATPLKRSTKPKRLKPIPRNKAGTTKPYSDKNQMYTSVHYCYKD